MHAGGLTAANCTCCVWEGFTDTMRNVAAWKAWISENDDLLIPVMTTGDIERAKAEGKVGIILGWQNISAIEDQLSYLRLFWELGVRVVQLTYNTQNLAGSGCWESRDNGLSDFGRQAIDEMNLLGILIDLSHVGSRTSREAIVYSKKPLVYTHVCPSALHSHVRNKSDEELRFIVDKGGFVGVATFPPFLPKESDSSVDDCVAVVEYIVNLVGEDNVGIGTDFTQNQSADWFDWLKRDKGYARWLVEDRGTVASMPICFETLDKRANLTAAMEARGWSEPRIRKVLGENWMRVYQNAWGQ